MRRFVPWLTAVLFLGLLVQACGRATAPPTSTEPQSVPELQVAGIEKLDPLLVDLMLLLSEPGQEGAVEELNLLRELIALPADARLGQAFLVDILIGVTEGTDIESLRSEDSLSGKLLIDSLPDLASQLQAQLGEQWDLTRIPDEFVAPTYDGVTVYTGRIQVDPGSAPAAQPLAALAEDSRVLSVEPSFINQEALDVSVSNSSQNVAGGQTWLGINASALWPQVRGEGVVVGIVDSGIDWDHEAFTTPGPPETTRLWWQWDQVASSFTSQWQLDANLADAVNAVYCRPGGGFDGDHGTHVAGIAAGDETATGGRFPGVAPRARIADVRTTRGDWDIFRGVGLVFLSAWAGEMPAVVNLSLGSHFGPHDGTNLLDLGLAALTGPGRLIVAAAGNERRAQIHTDNDAVVPIPAGGPGTIGVNVPAGVRIVDIRVWFDAPNNYSANVAFGAVAFPVAAPNGWSKADWPAGFAPANNKGRVLVWNTEINPVTGDRMVEVLLLATVGELPAGVWSIQLSRPAGAGGSGRYDAWIAYSDTDSVTFAAPTTSETISEPGTSPTIITVGSFNSKAAEECQPLGGLSQFSSEGPTRAIPGLRAGNPKPDLVAPGCTIESAQNSPSARVSLYVVKSGTSMAAPHMTGCAALMLQVNAKLTPAQVSAMVRAGWFVRSDVLVPALPNSTWGNGKLCCGCDNDGDGTPDLLQVADDKDGDGTLDLLQRLPSAGAPLEQPYATHVTVLGEWTEAEFVAFQAAGEFFTSDTGTAVDLVRVGSGQVPSQLTDRVEAGDPPDIAILPNPPLLYEFARKGALVEIGAFLDVDRLREDYGSSWLDLGSYQGRLYAIFYRASLDSIVWYSPRAFEAQGYAVPASWEEMIALSDEIVRDGGVPWCLGLESGSASGWPAADWIEEILIRTGGSEVYDAWVNHAIPWTDPAVKRAWELFGQVARKESYVCGGIGGVLSTSFADSPKGLFYDPPGCYMHRQGSFAPSLFGEGLVPMTDYAFFPFPPIDPAYGSPMVGWASPVVMFSDTAAARAFMQYLASPEAQAFVPREVGWISPNKLVSLDLYPDALTGRMAEAVTEAEAFHFAASDLMPQAVTAALWNGAMDYVSGVDLESVLGRIEHIAEEAYR